MNKNDYILVVRICLNCFKNIFVCVEVNKSFGRARMVVESYLLMLIFFCKSVCNSVFLCVDVL